MKTIILLFLTSIFTFAADQPSIRQRRVVLELDGISTNQSLTTPTVPSIANGSLVKQDSGLVAAGEGTDYLGPARISDTAYGAGWDGDTANTASKNAIYDIVNTFASSVSDEAYDEATWNGVTTVAPSKNAVRDAIESLGGLVFSGNADQFGLDENMDVVIIDGALVTNLVSRTTLTADGDLTVTGNGEFSLTSSLIWGAENFINSPSSGVFQFTHVAPDTIIALVVGDDAYTDKFIMQFDPGTGIMDFYDETGSDWQTIRANFIAGNGVMSADSFESTGASAGSLRLGDGGSEHFRIAPPDMTTSINYIPPPAAFTGLQKFVASATTNWTGSAAVAGTDYLTLATLTNTITFALSDMTTALTTGTNKNYWYAPPGGMTIKWVRATVATASSSGTPTFDINENGTTILSTKITIDAGAWDSNLATTPPVISDATIAGNAKLDMDTDVAGTDTAGAQIQIGYTSP